MIKKLLYTLVIVSIIASVPLLIDRYHGETSTSSVEVVIDYEKVLRLVTRSDTDMTEADILQQLKRSGANSVAVYESTIQEWLDRGIIELYSTDQLNLFYTDWEELPGNQSMMLFSTQLSAEERQTYQQMVLDAFGADAVPYLWQHHEAILIEHPINAIQQSIIGFDPYVLELVQAEGYQIVARIYSNRPFEPEKLEKQLERLHTYGVQTIIFDGSDILGYDLDHPEQLEQLAEQLNDYAFNFAIIEFYEQTGDRLLSYLTDHRTIRLLSVSERDLVTDTEDRLSDMLSLGITERNIRMVYINLPLPSHLATYTNAEELITKANAVISQTANQIGQKNYVLGTAIPFYNDMVKGAGWHRILVLIGALAMISLFAAKYHRWFLYIPLPVGMIGYVGAQLIDKGLLFYQAIALAAAIAAPTYATIQLIEWLKRRAGQRVKTLPTFIFSFGLLIICSLISLYGALVVVSLLNHLVFIKYIEQFRGVKLLYVAPLILLAIYILRSHSYSTYKEQLVKLLNQPLYVKHVLLGVVVLGAIGYFLTRSGNAGMALPFESELRQLLNDLFGVRPRTKELFLGHPLFIVATYFMLRYGKGIGLFLVGIIGQMSIVSTFTHLHTPLLISLERTVYGIIGGAVLAAILIFAWHVIQTQMMKKGSVFDR